jgi:peptidoglycan/xylan/chitin deacetylase (PgdA/CDA1 family)
MSRVLSRAPALLSWRDLRVRVAPELAGIGAGDHVALTFDDGPGRGSTPAFLDRLAARRVRATFFMLGSQIRQNAVLACEVAAAGHEIALHGYDHRCLLTRSPKAVRDDLRRGYDTIGGLIGVVPRWWRPPYGVLTRTSLRASRQLGLQPVLWTAWGHHWTRPVTAGSVYERVRRHLCGGGTVLLHDSDITAAPGSWRSALGAIDQVIDQCAEQGWRIGPLADHGIDRE